MKLIAGLHANRVSFFISKIKKILIINVPLYSPWEMKLKENDSHGKIQTNNMQKEEITT